MNPMDPPIFLESFGKFFGWEETCLSEDTTHVLDQPALHEATTCFEALCNNSG